MSSVAEHHVAVTTPDADHETRSSTKAEETGKTSASGALITPSQKRGYFMVATVLLFQEVDSPWGRIVATAFAVGMLLCSYGRRQEQEQSTPQV